MLKKISALLFFVPLSALLWVSLANCQVEISPASTPGPTCSLRPDLNGLRLRDPGSGAVFLVDQGCIKHIPDELTYTNLFGNNRNITNCVDVYKICEGPGIQSGAILAKDGSDSTVFLINGGKRRPICSADIFNKYGFDWNQIQTVQHIMLISIPIGDPVCN
jgi:hypothetical protein